MKEFNIKTLKRNKVKYNLYLEQRKSFASDQEFQNIWNYAMKSVRRTYRFGHFSKNRQGKSYSVLTEMLIQDKLKYKSKAYLNLPDLDFENEEDIFVSLYRLRTESFFAKYGDEEVKFKLGKEVVIKTLNEWFIEFENGKITQEDMNLIIKEYKDSFDGKRFYVGSD